MPVIRAILGIGSMRIGIGLLLGAFLIFFVPLAIKAGFWVMVGVILASVGLTIAIVLGIILLTLG